MKQEELNKIGLDNKYISAFSSSSTFDKEHVSCILVEHGMKLLMNQECFNVLIGQEYIKRNFKLKVKLDDGVYNVYFEGKEYLLESEIGKIEYF